MCLFLTLREIELVRGNELSFFLKSPLSDTFLCPLEMSRSLACSPIVPAKALGLRGTSNPVWLWLSRGRCQSERRVL